MTTLQQQEQTLTYLELRGKHCSIYIVAVPVVGRFTVYCKAYSGYERLERDFPRHYMARSSAKIESEEWLAMNDEYVGPQWMLRSEKTETGCVT